MKPNIRVVQSTKHGKAAFGMKVRCSFQVRDYNLTSTGYILRKSFPYKVDNEKTRERALRRANRFAETL